MFSAYFARSLSPFVAFALLLSLIAPAISLAAIDGAYDNDGAGPTGEAGVGQKADVETEPEEPEADDPCNIEEPIKKSDSDDCKILKANKVSISDTIANAKALGFEVDEAKTRAALTSGDIHTGQIIDTNGEAKTISSGYRLKTDSGNANDRFLEDSSSNTWDWYNETSQVKTGALDKVIKDAVEGSNTSTRSDNTSASELLQSKQAELQSKLNDLANAQSKNIEAREELQLIPDQNAVEKEHIAVDDAIENIEDLSGSVKKLAQAQADLDARKDQMSASNYSLAQAQINEALASIEQSYSVGQTSTGSELYTSNSVGTEIANAVSEKAVKVVNMVTGKDTSTNDRFNYLNPNSLIGDGGDTPYGEDTLGKFVQLSPSQEGALFGSQQDSEKMTDILIGENTDLAKKISDSVKNGTPLSREDVQEAIGITYGICDNRAIKSSCFNSDGSVNGAVYSSFIGPEGQQEVDNRKRELASKGILTEVETNVQRFFEDNMEKGLLGSGFTGHTIQDELGNVSGVSTVDDLIAEPLATHSYSPAGNFKPSWYEAIIPGTLTETGDHMIATTFYADRSGPEFDVMKKYKVIHKTLPENITKLDVRQQGFTPDFMAGTLGESPNNIGSDLPSTEITPQTDTFTLSELGITNLDSVPDIPAPPDGWGKYVGAADVEQTVEVFKNKRVEEFVVGVVAADNLGINVFEVDNEQKKIIADRVAKLTRTPGADRRYETDVTVNNMTIPEQVQIAVTEYNIKNNRNLSVHNFSEMGPHGSHRHRQVDDTTKGQGCACAVDVWVKDENGQKIHVRNNEELYKEIAKNYIQNTGGGANYSSSYMKGVGFHFDVANLNPKRSGIAPAYTSNSKKNENSFARTIRSGLNISYDYDNSNGGREYVKNYNVTPKNDTFKETIVIGGSNQPGQNSDSTQITAGSARSNGTARTTASGLPTNVDKVIDTVVPIIRAMGPNNSSGFEQFLSLSSGLFKLAGQITGQNSGSGSTGISYTNPSSYPDSPTASTTDLFDTRKLVNTNGTSSLPKSASRLSDAIGLSRFAGQGVTSLFNTLNATYKNLFSNSLVNNSPEKTLNLSTEEVENQRTIPVTVTVNKQTQEIELSRDDIINQITRVEEEGGEVTEFDEYYLYADDNPLVLGQNNRVVYSNGLYAPSTESFDEDSEGDNPVYVYLIRHVDENGNLISSKRSDSLPDETFLEKLSSEMFDNSGLYAFEDITDAAYELIDPDPSVPQDEYNEYVIRLTDGSNRAVKVPEYTNVATIREQFFASGYRGNVIAIMNSAREVDSAEAEKRNTLMKGVIDKVSGAFNQLVDLFRQDSNEVDSFTDLENINQTNRSTTKLTLDHISGLYIYPEAPTACEDNRGYVFDAFVRDFNNPDVITVITEDRCGLGSVIDMTADAAAMLVGEYGFTSFSARELLSKTYINLDPIEYEAGITTINASELPEPDTDQPIVEIEDENDGNGDGDTDIYIPNTTNTVLFEVKVSSNSSETVTDWTSNNVSISSGEQLAFRWNATDYSQCLVFLNDNGLYTLKKRDDSRLLSGNTEAEEFDIAEYSGTYRIECGGQENGEFGVDIRQINVTAQ